MSIRTLLCALLVTATFSVGAQQPAAQQQPASSKQSQASQLTPEQREAIVKFRKAMVSNATQVAHLVDEGQAAKVWDNGSDVMKKSIPRDKFVKGVEKQRASAGKLESRKLLKIYRTNSEKGSKSLPAGNYFNVLFVSRFANESPMLELVSYHYDSPTLLRVSGYALEKPKPRTAGNGKGK